MEEPTCHCWFHRQSEEERTASIQRAMDAANADLQANAGKFSEATRAEIDELFGAVE